MKIFKKLLKQEKGSITMTVLASMLFITTVLVVSYFSISNQSSNQNRKIQQISKEYSVTDAQMEERYNQLMRELNNMSFIKIDEIKQLDNIMLGKETNTTTTDEEGNSLIIPAGFKLTEEGNNVTEGMVIEDKNGNQFVWIPVGIKKKSNENEQITLIRGYFNEKGVLSSYSEKAQEEEFANRKYNYENSVAKNINDFITKTNSAGGFWIGRYEARTEIQRNNSNNSLTQVTERANDYVYNYVTQPQAAKLAGEMYNTNDCFECDLINSYAWDTATLFLQEYDNRESKPNVYSRQNSLNTEISTKGTAIDKICNVYDMASNCYEWTTETYNDSQAPCLLRGGSYEKDYYYTSIRSNHNLNTAYKYNSFRPIIYIK